MSNFNQKLAISLNSAILFYIINHPTTYNFTSSLLDRTLIALNCPTNLGIILHTIIFFFITYYSMNNAKINEGIKIKHSLYGTLIYFFISSQAFYSFIQLILNINLSNCPSNLGIIMLSIIYCFSLVAVMYLP